MKLFQFPASDKVSTKVDLIFQYRDKIVINLGSAKLGFGVGTSNPWPEIIFRKDAKQRFGNTHAVKKQIIKMCAWKIKIIWTATYARKSHWILRISVLVEI